MCFDSFKLPDSKAHGWAWLLWADTHFVGHASFDAEVFVRLQEIICDEDKRGATLVRDKKKGEKLFKAMQHERAKAIPANPTSEVADTSCVLETVQTYSSVLKGQADCWTSGVDDRKETKVKRRGNLRASNVAGSKSNKAKGNC